MSQIADHAVTITNASPELKNHAMEIIGASREDSVVNYLREHWTKNKLFVR